MLEAAKCAKEIKSLLRKTYPGTKFSVRSDQFAGGDAVRISYTDGPASEEVNKLVSKYQYGNFDGMTDMYEYSNTREDIPQAKYVQVQRSMSPQNREAWLGKMNRLYGLSYTMDDVNGSTWDDTFNCWVSQLLERVIRDHEVKA